MPSDQIPGLARRTGRSMAWTAGATLADALLQLATLLILARLLEPADFGLVGASVIVMNLALVLGRVGLGPAIIRAETLDRPTITTAFTLSLSLGCALGLALFVGSRGIAQAFRIDELAPVVRMMALALPLSGAALVSESLLRRDLRFRALTTVGVTAQAVAYLAVGIPMARQGYGAWALAAAHMAQAAGRLLLLVCVRPHPIGLTIDGRRARRLLADGAHLTVAGIGAIMARQGDQLIVGRWLGTAALGIYSRAYQIMMAPAHVLGHALEEVLLPAMVTLRQDPPRLRAAYRRAVGLSATVVLPVSAVACILAPELIVVALGDQWADLVLPFQILTLGMYFRTSFRVTQAVAKATGAVAENAVRYTVFGGLVPLSAWVGQSWGLGGVAAAGVVVLAVHFLSMTQLSLRAVDMGWLELLRAHRSGLLGVGAMLVVAAPLTVVVRAQGYAPATTLALSLVIALSAYGGVLLLRPRTVLDEWQWMIGTALGVLPSIASTRTERPNRQEAACVQLEAAGDPR